MSERQAFFGKYRGTVIDNCDPEHRGRIKAHVNAIYQREDPPWALPCVPYAGQGVGLFLIPPEQAWVWIEFEHGDPDFPVWSGCFWGSASEVPAPNGDPATKMLKTDLATFMIEDSGPKITIETNGGVKIVLDDQGGAEISDAQGAVITLSGAQVSVNNGALEVQ